MNKINQFTFNDDPKSIMDMALDLFGDKKVTHDNGYFLISTENEKFIDYISKLYKIEYYKLDEHEYIVQSRRINMGIDSLKPMPIYGFISYNDLSNCKGYKEDKLPFENFLSYQFGIECHYIGDISLVYDAVRVDNYKDMK